ncbi:MAG: hypothetical protein QOF13_157 [Solirubrobacterales bacterium]|jgi:hypothetical protein|nr:hypothetical protein [Solirubrobacterales bacterium]
MLSVGRYLLGTVELAALVGFAWLGATTARERLTPELSGAGAQLSTAVLGIAGLLSVAELLGTFGWFTPAPYLAVVIAIGLGLRLGLGGRWGGPSGAAASRFSHRSLSESRQLRGEKPSKAEGPPHRPSPATLIALAIAAVAVVKFGLEVKPKLDTGMTGFDSTWYHGPFAAGFFESGDTWGLHFIAPQFLAWFYPVNSEVLHAVGMLAFDRDILSPLLNLGWFVGCLAAAWCIGRPYRAAPWSLALAAIALSIPALSDQAGEARNDIVGIFFLLAAVAIALNAWSSRTDGGRGLKTGAFVVIGLAAGLAAGTKLNFLLPAGVLVAGLVVLAPGGARLRSLAAAGLAALAGGGYWYLRNLAHTGNPLPWIKHLGPITLPAPEQALGGREDHSVLGYLTDGSVWSDWFLPGLHHGLTVFWPLALALAAGGLVLCLGRRADPMLRVAGIVGLATALAWLIAPTSASGPDGMPRGFESGLRYLAPALALGLALLPTTPLLRNPLAQLGLSSPLVPDSGTKGEVSRRVGQRVWIAAGVAFVLLVVVVGYPIQRHYLESRYADPSFTTPGLNAAFKWAQGITDARIATTSTRQYPLYGRDLSNEVDYVGNEQPHGGFTVPTTCRSWRRLLNEGDYDYVVASRDRIEPGKPSYLPSVAWTEGPSAAVVLHKPPTTVLRLTGYLDSSSCPR